MADFSLYAPKLKALEGGASNSKTDTASKNPSPCTIGGKTNVHTNEGITWTTFVANASKYGYVASCANFSAMPDSIWNNIAKGQYWDIVGADNIDSQAVAELMADMAFNGYHVSDIQDYLDSKNLPNSTVAERADSLNTLASADETGLYGDLIGVRTAYYQSLNQPSNINGWLNRLKTIASDGYDLISSAANTVSTDVVSYQRVLYAYLAGGFIIGIGYYMCSRIYKK